MKISLLKKIKLFFFFKKNIKLIEEELFSELNLRIDNSYRLYTVLNIPQDAMEEPYNIRKQDIEAIGSNYVREHARKLSTIISKYGLMELCDIYDIKKIDKYNYLLVYGFSLFKSNKFISNIYKISIVIILSLILFFSFKTLFF